MNRFKKELKAVEIHRFAPELNKLHFKSGAIIPYFDYKKMRASNSFRKSVSILVRYKEDRLRSYDRFYCGFMKDYKSLLDFKKRLINKHNAGSIEIKIEIGGFYE